MADCVERDYSSDSSNDSFNELLNLKIFSQESILPAQQGLNDNDDGNDDIEVDENHSDGKADEKNDNNDNDGGNEDKSPRQITQSDEEPSSLSMKAAAAETARGTSRVSRMNVTPPKEPKAIKRNAQSPLLSNDDFLTEQDLEAKAKSRAQMPLLPKKVGHPSALFFRLKLPKKGRNSGFGNSSSGTSKRRRRKKKPDPLYFPCRVVPTEEALGLALRAPVDESGDVNERGEKVERVVQYVQFPHAFLKGGVGQYEVVSVRSLIPFYGEEEGTEAGTEAGIENDKLKTKEKDEKRDKDGRDEQLDEEKGGESIADCDDSAWVDDGNGVKSMDEEENVDAMEKVTGRIDQVKKNEIGQTYTNKPTSELEATEVAAADAAQTNTAATDPAPTDTAKTNAAIDATATYAAASEVRSINTATNDAAAPADSTKTKLTAIDTAASDTAACEVATTNTATTNEEATLPPPKSTFPLPSSSSLSSTTSATTPTTSTSPKLQKKRWCPIILEKYLKQLKQTNRNFQPMDLKTEELYLERVLDKSYLEEEEALSKNEILLNGNQDPSEYETPSDNGKKNNDDIGNRTKTKDDAESKTSARNDPNTNSATAHDKPTKQRQLPAFSTSTFSDDEEDLLRPGIKRPRRSCNPYKNPSSISHLEPLRPGDIIAFYKPPYGHGNSFGYAEAEILAVDPRAEEDGKDTPILTLDDYMIHLPSDHMVKRIRRRVRGGRKVENEMGKFRKIGAYVLKKEGDAEKALRKKMEEDAERGREIVERNKRILKEKLKEVGGPCDLIR